MRSAERIDLAVFSFLLLLSVMRPLPPDRRLKAIGMGVVGFTLTLLSANLPDTLSPLVRSVIRDWLPAPLMLLVYWQAGHFFLRVQPDFQRRLARLDETLVAPILLAITRRSAGRWLLA